MYFLGAFVWAAICIFIARTIVRWFDAQATKHRYRPLLTSALVPILFISPLTDEIIGKYQFDRLCEAAKDVKIYGTHPVGEELYMPDGTWRIEHLEHLRRIGQIPDPFREQNRLEHMYKSLIEYGVDGSWPKLVPAAIVIYWYHTKIIDKTDGRLLAEYDQYGTPGGWLSRNFEAPFLVKSQCLPPLVDKDLLKFTVLPFLPKGKEK